MTKLWNNGVGTLVVITTSMSKTKLNQSIVGELWWRAGGRCEFNGCNKELDVHGVTMDKCNLSNCAHIIADSPKGPRGTEDSESLAKDPNNIMLMCPECHKYIDHEGKDKYDAETLRAMKRNHEKRIRFLTGLTEDQQAHFVTFGSKIGDTKPEISFQEIQCAALPDYYPSDVNPINLGGKWYSQGDWDSFWKDEVDNIVYNCKEQILRNISRWEHNRIALFALAPMPSLVKLGTQLNNKLNVEVFQRHRSSSWKWESSGEDVEYIVNRPHDTGKKPVLVLSLSFPITERIQRRYGTERSIWEMTISNPNPDFLKKKKDLEAFCRKLELLLDDINRSTDFKELDLFLAVPASCAVEIGRVWMQKANPALNIYDYDKRITKEDKLAITITN